MTGRHHTRFQAVDVATRVNFPGQHRVSECSWRRGGKRARACLQLIVLGIGMLTVASVQAQNFYRYVNDEGRTVITYSVDADAIRLGYDVIDSRTGLVVQSVERALNEAEKAALAAAAAEREAQREQEAADRRLLAIFSGPQDAIRARDRKLESIDVFINVTRGNMLALQNDFEAAQARAAAAERAGNAVPEFLVEKMTSLQRQIEQAEVTIAAKEEEKLQIAKDYEADIQRLEWLIERSQSHKAERSSAH